ncbi:MAG: hypothetical protein PHI01_06065, partial [Candidatus Izemoplasmatales bacterium]|nr:hypothetical protein [Candidatus Izemoplasmatales bacterium]
CLGFTHLRGLKKNHDRNLIVFAAANLKKLALFVAETNKEFKRISACISCFFNRFRLKKQKAPQFLY